MNAKRAERAIGLEDWANSVAPGDLRVPPPERLAAGMNEILDRTWVQRGLGVGLIAEAAYVLGLTILLGLIAPSSSRFDGDPLNPVALALGWGLGVAAALVLGAAGVLLWRANLRGGNHRSQRTILLLASILHLLVAVGVGLAMLAVVLGDAGRSSSAASVTGSVIVALAVIVIASALATLARRTGGAGGMQRR